MATLTIDIKGLNETLKMFTEFPAKAEKTIDNEFKSFGINVVSDAKILAPTNLGQLKNAISSYSSRLQVTIAVNVDYAAYLEFGTKAFAAAYVGTLPATWQEFAIQFKGKSGGNFAQLIKAIMQWVKDKGIATGKDVQNAAYLISRSIIQKGIRPHPYLIPAFEKNKIELINNIKNALNA